MTIHHAAAEGYERASNAYERGRPSYPEDAVDALVRELSIVPGRVVLDLAAGTGKLTRLLAPTAASIIAVEPVAAMRARLQLEAPTARALEGTAEAIPLDTSSVDAVVVAQAFHWFDGPRALREIHRILRPNGRLALIWNARDESVPWVRDVSELVHRHAGDAPSYRTGLWRRAFEATTAFSPLRELGFVHTQSLDEQGLRDRFGSISYIAALDAPTRETLLDDIVARAKQASTAPFALPTRTHLYLTDRL
jgi:SAM-dependent methyltransferase